MALPDATFTTDLAWPPASPEKAVREAALAWWIRPGAPVTPEQVENGTNGGANPLKRKVRANLAADIARTAADLLWGSIPDLNVTPADSDTSEGLTVEQAKEATARLRTLMEDGGGWSTISTATEQGAALGGSYVYATWDDLIDHPILVSVPATQAIPDFRYGRLVGVTFSRTVHQSGQTVWRLLTRHEPPRQQPDGTRTNGRILNGLYVGTVGTLGATHPAGLEGHPATTGLPPEAEVPGAVRTAWYVPNRSANPATLGGDEGAPEWAGTEDMLAALDETQRSIVRDIRLARKRLVISQDMLQTTGVPGGGATWDEDRELYTDLAFTPNGDGTDSAGITPVDFTLQVDGLIKAADYFAKHIVEGSGYSPQTFGYDIDGSAPSGTAMRVREGKTIATVGAKRKAWSPVVTEIAQTLLTLDALVYNRATPVARPAITWGPVREDPLESAQTIQTLDAAGALSTETKVRLAQPGLNQEDLAAEVSRIREQTATAPDPFRFGA